MENQGPDIRQNQKTDNKGKLIDFKGICFGVRCSILYAKETKNYFAILV